MTKSDILSNMNNPKGMESLYQENKADFKKEFNSLYPDLKDTGLVQFWYERLNYESPDISWGTKRELIFMAIAIIVSAVTIKLPEILNINREVFYERNAGFIFFPGMVSYFFWRNGLPVKKVMFAAVLFLVSVVFINLLPYVKNSDTLDLSCIHLPLFLWGILGFAFLGNDMGSYSKRLDFLRYNGDMVIMSGLLLIAGGILTGLTIGLFDLIGFKIERFYTRYIASCGLAAIPIIATYITQKNPLLVNKISPVIAKIFSPLVLITLVAYLVAIISSGKDPYNDRDFLLVFNLLLIGVMAIILFSVAETFKREENRAGSIILTALAIVTVIVNGIALSAILFRISGMGITPNRLAILGSNLLILINLLFVSVKLFKNVIKKGAVHAIEDSISMFLPVYIVWTVIVTFVFPFIFHFR